VASPPASVDEIARYALRGLLISPSNARGLADLLRSTADDVEDDEEYVSFAPFAVIGIPAGWSEWIAAALLSDRAAMAERIAGLERELDEAQSAATDWRRRSIYAQDGAAESMMLAFKWMTVHHRHSIGLPYTLPRPADLPDALRRAEASEAEVGRLREALRVIAEQHLPEEMDADDRDNADWEGGWGLVVTGARAALTRPDEMVAAPVASDHTPIVALATPDTLPTGWNSDMGAAPRDGTSVLLYVVTPPGDQYAVSIGDPEGWQSIEAGRWDDGDWFKMTAGEPTHWMPLPPPPGA
jgi:hypothetical protein